MSKVRLTVRSLQRDADGTETAAETVTEAEYYEKNGSHYILYEECMGDTGTAVKTMLKLKGPQLELTRKGAVTARMVFESGKEYASDYVTPYGCLKMDILTRKLETGFDEGLLHIQAEYSLTSAGRHISDCTITIKLQE